jgi:hypothetical protein
MALGIYKRHIKSSESQNMAHKEETTTLLLRLPKDVKAWIEHEASRNLASQNSEILRCIRARMDIEQPKRATG